MSTEQLTAARLKVMEAVPYLRKRSSPNLNYTFAGEADLIQNLRPAMLANGITCHPVSISDVHKTDYQTSKGSVMRDVTAVLTYRMTHVSGESEDVVVLAEAADSGDKSAAKLMTIGEKYALRQYFLIETGDDPDEVAAERASTNAQNVTKAMEMIAKAKVPEELDGLLDRVIAAGEAVFDAKQVARLEKAITSKRVALTAKKKGN